MNEWMRTQPPPPPQMYYTILLAAVHVKNLGLLVIRVQNMSQESVLH